MTIVTSERVVLDPYDYAFQNDPYPTYAWLREHEPLHHNPELDLWALMRHEDIAAAFKSDGVYSNSWGVAIEQSAWGPDAHKVMSILGMDPPRQNRLRALVSRGFTPRRVHDLLPRIKELTDRYLGECLEKARDGQSIDWIADFAGKPPDGCHLRDDGRPRGGPRGGPPSGRHRGAPRGRRVRRPGGGCRGVAVAGRLLPGDGRPRRKQPSDDLTSALIEAELDGERLSDEDVIAFLFLMVVAGNETTTKLLGHAVYHLTQHPEQLEKVFGGGGNTELVTPWVEETLRFDTSSQLLARYLLQDVELHGAVAPQGSKLLLCLGSANRDERVFSRPDEYDITRDPDELAKILSFGGGRHFCLGANLARLEARIALTALVERASSISVDHEASRRVHSVNVRGFAVEPMTVVPR